MTDTGSAEVTAETEVSIAGLSYFEIVGKMKDHCSNGMFLVLDEVDLRHHNILREKMGAPIISLRYDGENGPRLFFNKNGRWDIQSRRLYARTEQDAMYARLLIGGR